MVYHAKEDKTLMFSWKGKPRQFLLKSLARMGKKTILGSMYHPPNTQIQQFGSNLIEIINKVRNARGKLSPKIVIGMDHNIDLLKGIHHTPTHKFI